MRIPYKLAVVALISVNLIFPATAFAQNETILDDDGYEVTKTTYTVTSVNISTSDIYGGCKVTMSADSYEKEEVTVKQKIKGAGNNSSQEDYATDINDSIYYTIDGSDPYSGEHYSGDGFELKEAGTYKIKAVANYMSGAKHEIATELVTIKKAPKPYIDASVFGSYADVEISDGYDDAILYYTTDGSDPTEDSQQYDGSFEIDEMGETTLRAIAVVKGLAPSDIVEKTVYVSGADDDGDNDSDDSYSDDDDNDDSYDSYSNDDYDYYESDDDISEETEDDYEKETDNKLGRVTVTVGKEKVDIDGEKYSMNAEAYIQKSSNSVLVPLRFIYLAINNGEVDLDTANNKSYILWDADKKTVTIIYQLNSAQRIIQFTAGSNEMVIDGTTITMMSCATAEITDGRMYVPFRALGLALNVNVDWDAETRSAIYYP